MLLVALMGQYKFYGTSSDARQFLEEHRQLRAENTLQEIYDRVKKTNDINRHETAPRPELQPLPLFTSQMGCHLELRPFRTKR
jgi:hypothetical protein